MPVEIGRVVAQNQPAFGYRIRIGQGTALLQTLREACRQRAAQRYRSGFALYAQTAMLLQQAENLQIFLNCQQAQLRYASGMLCAGHAVQIVAQHQQCTGDRQGRGDGHSANP